MAKHNSALEVSYQNDEDGDLPRGHGTKYMIEVDGLGVFGDFRSKSEATTAFKKYVAHSKVSDNKQFPTTVTLLQDGRVLRKHVGAHEVGGYRETTTYKALEKLIHKHALDAGLLLAEYDQAIIEALSIIMHVCDERNVTFSDACQLADARYKEETQE